MVNKNFKVFIIVGIIALVLFSFHSLSSNIPKNNLWSTYIDQDNHISLRYLSEDNLQKVNNATLSLLALGDTKPYIIHFKEVPYQSFQSWYIDQTWSRNQQDYLFSTTTLGQPMIVNNITEMLYTMVRPGLLVTIENALSPEGYYQSDKILMEMSENIKSL